MKTRWNRTVCLAVTAIAIAGLQQPQSIPADEPSLASERPASKVAGEGAESSDDDKPSLKRVSLEVARDRARLLHDVYSATLDTMHHRYFHGDRAVIPARAMEDMFEELQRTSDAQARWISVNLKAMSLDHEPESKFEKLAAARLGTGQEDVESVEDGYYRRATPIPLGSGCISCHSGLFRKPADNPKFAGLVISIPVHREVKSLPKSKPASQKTQDVSD